MAKTRARTNVVKAYSKRDKTQENCYFILYNNKRMTSKVNKLFENEMIGRSEKQHQHNIENCMKPNMNSA